MTESEIFSEYANGSLRIWDIMAKHRKREREALIVAGIALVLILTVFVAASTFDHNHNRPQPSYPAERGFGGGGGGGLADISLSGTILWGPMFLRPGIRGPWETIFGWIGSAILGHYFEPIVDCAAGPDPCVPPNGVGGGGGGGIQPDPVPGGGGGWVRKASLWNYFTFKNEDK